MKTKLFFLTVILISITAAVQAQILTSVVPDTGTQCEKLTITVTGENTNFYQGTSFLKLSQNGFDINSTSNTVISSTQIEGEFFFNPDQPTGSYDVNVNNGYWGDIILEDGFWLNPPTLNPQLISMMPENAYRGESIVISITAENSHFNANGVYNLVRLHPASGSYITATSVTTIDSLHLEANLAISYNHPTGYYSLHVSNALDGEMILPDAFEVLENGQNPEIVSVIPNTAYQGEGLTITVTGAETNFQQGSSMLHLQNNSGYISPINHNVLNDTVITGYFEFNNDYDTGYYDVNVTNWLLEDLILEDGFHLLASGGSPNLLSVTPGSAFEGTRAALLIKAVDTKFDKEGNTASVTLIQGFEELYCHDIVVIDSVTLEANYIFSYENYLGNHDLVVETPFDGTMTLENCFSLIESEPNASIVEVVPDSAYLGDTLIISVTGTGIIFMQGTSNMNLSQGNLTIFASNETIVNDTVISSEFNFLNTFPAGKYDVNVDNGYAWPSMSLTEGFTLELFDFIDDPENLALLTVYPNPTNGLLNIKRNFNAQGIFYLKIFNIKGELLLEDNIENGTYEKQLDLTSFAKGTYLLMVMKNRQEQTRQFVIQ